eukprot:NODE_600_length_2033_cov_64.648478_g558_i0.p1 GENE.NODE_600_length_2033_cov_64.648478_g558_i0~~NODE_600_length_2033_cov_64.648478_g558_i0.p1  ORF type:complete len:486 (-),score=90.22 NODE_600_length_2033_cov_64.648478_g558_i0:510-1967(-)
MEWQRYIHAQKHDGYRGGHQHPRPYRGHGNPYSKPAYRPARQFSNYDRRPQPQPRRAQVTSAPPPQRNSAYSTSHHHHHPSPAHSFTSFLKCNSAFPYMHKVRNLTDVCHRYPRLCVSEDFSKIIHHWVDQAIPIPMDVQLNFRAAPEQTVPAPTPEVSVDGQSQHIARVMLLSVQQPEEDKEDAHKSHLLKRVKFLVGKSGTSGLMSIGGPWAAQDGADPTKDSTLIKTAIRHCKAICGVDLSPCTQWIKFVEIHYNRPSGAHDRTVIFLPNVWNHLSREIKIYKQVERKELEVEEEVEVEVELEEKDQTEEKKTTKITKKVKTTKVVDTVLVRSMDLSMNGILEYDQQDQHPETAELSLFAEAFDEMLCSKYAKDICALLKEKKVKADIVAEEAKRKREAEDEAKAARIEKEREERAAKRQKLEEERKLELERRKQQEEEERNMTEEQVEIRRKKENEEKKSKRRGPAKIVGRARGQAERGGC